MKESKKNLLWNVVKKMVEKKVNMENVGEPPNCFGFLYQPKRPKSVEIKK